MAKQVWMGVAEGPGFEKTSPVSEDALAPGLRARASRPRIWLVDDSPLQLEGARQALAPICDVTAYSTGEAMLEDFCTLSPPDVLVLDWQMPGISGVDVCRFVRNSRDRAEVPILMLTALGSETALIEALAAGANDFVKVPFSATELAARVSALAQLATLRAQLRDSERKLRVEADFRERFMGILAHDLRQPLNTMSMVHDLLSRGEARSTPTHFTEMHVRAAQRMKRMIQELLDFTHNRPESGLPLQREWVELAGIVAGSVDEFRGAHPENEIELSIEGSGRGYWDADRLAQICGNLIGNAIGHSPPGSKVTIQLTEDATAVKLRVSNLGQAIPEEALRTLFRPFRRGPNAKPSKGSVGLGLYIVKQIVLAHAGTISVESDERATCFIVALPRASSVEPEPPPRSELRAT